MRIFFLLIIISFSYFCHSQKSPLQAYWDDGLTFKTNDGKYKFSVGGRVHYDAAFLDHSSALDSVFGKSKNKTEIRRARLSFEGLVNNAIEYEFEFTFNETVEFADMFVAFLRAPFFDKLTIGHFREPFGLEELTSSNQIVFMERSLTSAVGPSRNTGFMVQKNFNNEKLNIYTGVFRITDDLGADLEGAEKYSISNRIVYNPVYDTANNKTVHFGFGINRHNPLNNNYLIESNIESDLSPAYINTGDMENVKSVTQFGGEFGLTKKRLFIQSEYIHTLAKHKDFVADINGSTRHINSFYAMASYFLKGGLRQYSRSGNKFSSVSLTEKYEEGSLSGAWEAGIRLSHINLNNTESVINNMTDVTLGLNWYFNSNSRIMMNYVHSFMNNNYSAKALQFRVQVSF